MCQEGIFFRIWNEHMNRWQRVGVDLNRDAGGNVFLQPQSVRRKHAIECVDVTTAQSAQSLVCIVEGDFDDLGQLPLKGFDAPIGVWRLRM